jgi:TPM domain
MVTMDVRRLLRHLTTTRADVRRAFPPRALDAIEAAIKASEARHVGQIRFAIEGGLDGRPLWCGQTARQRAIELFAQLHVWDTERNNGLLVYLLLADRAVEIVVDRGLHGQVPTGEWTTVCERMRASFEKGDFEQGAISGIRAVTQHLAAHFPTTLPTSATQPTPLGGFAVNELPDRPITL